MTDDARAQDDRVRSVPLPTTVGDGADQRVAQENQSPEVAVGGGEWPSPHTPPSDAAPGGPPPRIASRGRPTGAGDEEDDGEGAFPNMREVLEADPVAGGSQSVAGDGEGDEGNGRPGGGQGPDRRRWGGSRL